jgi:muramoyltetrapeptide carboxypeptidase LdcA involved in peptidoglycan recycling
LKVVTEKEGLTGIPIIAGIDFGHTDPMFVLPYGIQAENNCEERRFAIVENAVID